ncbi:MAG: DNA mismatch repair protein MutS, partial [Planctomycetota bacterium]
MTEEKILTPMMEQYFQAKSQSPGSVLFFRLGDFYEMFAEDAELCSKVLGLTLTSRYKGANAIPMAGIPAKSLDTYLQKMIQAGYKVAICEQLQEASESETLVERGITRIVTPGTVLEDSILPRKEHNFLLAIQPGKTKSGLAWLDLSTSLFLCHEVKNERVIDEIYQIQPAEILLDESLKISASSFLNQCQQTLHASLSKIPSKHFLLKQSRQKLLDHFKVTSLDGFGLEGMPLGISAAGAILCYLEETHRQSLGHILRISAFQEEDTLKLDRATIHCLELMETIRGASREGTLIQILDQTQTAMGARKLRSWILAPLKNFEQILARQHAILELMREHTLRQEIRQLLDKIYDLERISTRICCEQATPKDLVALGRSLKFTPPLAEILKKWKSPLLQSLSQQFDPLTDIEILIQKSIREDAPQTIKEGDLIREGYHAELDEIIKLCGEGKEWMAQFQAREIERTHIPLKIGYNRIFGYYIEITNAHKHKVPTDYHTKQTLKNGQRYFTTELKEYESKVLEAEERRYQLEYDIYLEIRNTIAKQTARIQQLAETCSTLDVLTGLAHIAVENDYQMPQISQETLIHIEEGKHPVLAKLLKGNECVPNSTRLEKEDQSL